MYIIRGINNMVPPLRGGVVTIGNFDGVHLGHQALFQALQQLANGLDNAPTLALSFEPHPRRLLNPEQAPERITSLRSKARWIKKSGINALFILHFTRELSAWQPEMFVRRILVEGLAAQAVMVGENFRFGAGGKGNFADLQALGQQLGFAVYAQPLLHTPAQNTQKNDGPAVSSTRIRSFIKNGQFAEAEQLLGHAFEMEARVIQGQQRGQKMGFPTANIALTGMLHPPPGVYVVEGWVQGQWLPAVANLGYNPTFGNADMRLEVHILATRGARFSSDLYRQVIRVRFVQRLRDEITFANGDALKQQIAADVLQAQAVFAQRRHD